MRETITKDRENFFEQGVLGAAAFPRENRRYYQIAGLTICIESESPITKNTFKPKFKLFEIEGHSAYDIIIRHRFSAPSLNNFNSGRKIYEKAPWTIYRQDNSWVYWGPIEENRPYLMAVFNDNYTEADIYYKKEYFLSGDKYSLSHFPTDQIILAQVLADRQGCFLHSSAIVFEGKGFIFAGHCEAGKSTIVRMLKSKARVLCDDRNIIKKEPDGFRVYGSWSHGEIPEISAGSAPLKAIFFLKKAPYNRIELLKEKKEVNKKLLSCLIRPLTTTDWWEKMLLFLDKVSSEVPCCVLHFDKSGKVMDLLREFN